MGGGHRIVLGEVDAGPSRQPQLVAYSGSFHGTIRPAATNFFDHEGAAYLGGLEEALMHEVASLRTTVQTATTTATTHHGDTKAFLPSGSSTATTRPPPTLEIFPSGPMRSLHTPKESSNVSESTDSGMLGSESPGSSSKNNTMASSDHRHQQQEVLNMVATSHDHHASPQQQEYKKMATGSTHSDRPAKTLDPKIMRRLAQNREAARKSRLRKKAYIQQLESSKVKLSQLEQDLQRARSQGLLLGGAAGGNISSGAAIFDMEYGRWVEEENRHMAELRGALHARLPDGDLRAIVDENLTHYDELFHLKAAVAKSDVFHLITGMWTSPTERCFLWMAGFRPSDLLKILIPQLDPLTEQQFVGICSLQQSSQQAEEALSQGLEQLHHSLAETVAGGSGSLIDGTDPGSYMGQMAIALGKVTNLEGFVRQADNLRQQTLHQMHRILTVRQAARCFLAIGEYHSRLRALSSLWASRPREILVADEGNCGDLPLAAHQGENQFSAF